MVRPCGPWCPLMFTTIRRNPGVIQVFRSPYPWLSIERNNGSRGRNYGHQGSHKHCTVAGIAERFDEIMPVRRGVACIPANSRAPCHRRGTRARYARPCYARFRRNTRPIRRGTGTPVDVCQIIRRSGSRWGSWPQSSTPFARRTAAFGVMFAKTVLLCTTLIPQTLDRCDQAGRTKRREQGGRSRRKMATLSEPLQHTDRRCRPLRGRRDLGFEAVSSVKIEPPASMLRHP
jgi:hypothetical protein